MVFYFTSILVGRTTTPVYGGEQLRESLTEDAIA